MLSHWQNEKPYLDPYSECFDPMFISQGNKTPDLSQRKECRREILNEIKINPERRVLNWGECVLGVGSPRSVLLMMASSFRTRCLSASSGASCSGERHLPCWIKAFLLEEQMCGTYCETTFPHLKSVSHMLDSSTLFSLKCVFLLLQVFSLFLMCFALPSGQFNITLLQVWHISLQI